MILELSFVLLSALPRPGVHEEPKTGIDAYDREHVWFRERLVFYGTKNAVSGGTFDEAVQGRFARPLRGADFYRAVDRPDLAEQYSNKNALKWGLFVGGSVVAVAGLGVMLAGVFTRSALVPMSIAGSIGAVAGCGIVLGAAFYNPHPVTISDAKALADEKNQRSYEREAPRPRVSVVPSFHLHGGGLSLAGQF